MCEQDGLALVIIALYCDFEIRFKVWLLHRDKLYAIATLKNQTSSPHLN